MGINRMDRNKSKTKSSTKSKTKPAFSNVHCLRTRALEKELVQLCIELREQERLFQDHGNSIHADRMEDITDDIIYTVDELHAARRSAI